MIKLPIGSKVKESRQKGKNFKHFFVFKWNLNLNCLIDAVNGKYFKKHNYH